MAGTPQVPADKGQHKELALGDKAKLHGQVHEQDRNVHRARMVGAEDEGLVGVHVLESLDPYADAAGLQNQPRPEAGASVLPPPSRIDKRATQ